MLAFLGRRALRGVECVRGDEYLRTIEMSGCVGWVRVQNAPDRRSLLVELSDSLAPVLPALLERLRNFFDVSATPADVNAVLCNDPMLADLVARSPGLRVPGAFDGFELALRAILGQQVTVKGASTLGGRFADTFGVAIETPHPELVRLTPTPLCVADASGDAIAALGIIRSRARCIITIAGEIASGRLELEAGADPDATMAQLVTLPGIGAWTAHYIAMRALRWTDAFPKADLVLRKGLGGVSAARAEDLSQRWRPWRSYATMHLWRSAAVLS